MIFNYQYSNVYKYLEQHQSNNFMIREKDTRKNLFIWAYTTDILYKEINENLNNEKILRKEEEDYLKCLNHEIVLNSEKIEYDLPLKL